MTRLIVFSGLPEAGKSTIARMLAQRSSAICLRIDSIEQAIRSSGVVPGARDDAGYRAAYAIADTAGIDIQSCVERVFTALSALVGSSWLLADLSG